MEQEKKEVNRYGENRYRLLCVKKIIEDYTDETGRDKIKTKEIISKLKEDYEIEAGPRTIIRDIYYLNEFLDPVPVNERFEEEEKPNGKYIRHEYRNPSIVKASRGKETSYYLKERDFLYSEVRLIADAIRSAKFISEDDSNALLKKVYGLTNKNNQSALKRHITRIDRVKSTSKGSLDIVDIIYKAIAGNNQLKFKYMEWTINKTLEPRKGGAFYLISPWAVTWDDGKYYLLGYDNNYDQIRPYRIDKISEVTVLEQSIREGRTAFEEYNISEIAKNTFNMFFGKKERVRMRFHNSLSGVVFDRFGTDGTVCMKDGADHFITVREISVSPQYFGWIAGLGGKATIVSPNYVAEEYAEYLKSIYSAQQEILNKK
ncbi:MAG: WYL domain-containing protein [Bacillota bacterium]|nr:WYL domain-containing protein [Bacillota bacterium]